MNIRSKKILVTGSEGFIGSHLVEALVREGANVRAFVLYNSFNSWGWLDSLDPKIKSQIEVVTRDVRDPHGVKVVMQDVDLVFHLAALIAIPYSYHSPSTYIDTNVQGTLNIVQAAREIGVDKVIHTSTSEVYGTAKFVPITEEHPLQGQSPYAASKIGADQIAMSYYTSFDTPISIIRPFNTYGPRQSARAVIPTMIAQIASGNSTVKLGSLMPTRDFNYVQDTVSAFIAVANSTKTVGEVVNAGSNFEVSIGDTVKIIAELMGREIEVIQDNQRIRPEKSEVERLWADNQKMLSLTDWVPQFAGLEGFKRGLEKTIPWFLKKENLSKYKSYVYNI